MIDEKFIQDALSENREAIKAHVKKTILDNLTEQFKWTLPRLIQEEVDRFIKAEILPEIATQLVADKALMVEYATKAAQGMAVEFGIAIQGIFAKSLASEHNLKAAMEKLLRGY